MLESALARPRNLFTYSPSSAVPQLAAAYAVGIQRNHPYPDGNKRTAWILCSLFLGLNGVSVVADQAAVVRVTLDVADNPLTEEEFVSWLERADVTAG